MRTEHPSARVGHGELSAIEHHRPAGICDAHAIHPGHGFLAENPKFARICQDCDIGFIGPTPEAIALSGDKAACRAKVKAAGVPVVPGSDGLLEDPAKALALAREIGFPVLVKASAGGGGKGMRIAHNDVALKNAISMASIEAETAFGDGGLYLEKFVEGARHVEFQILGDSNSKIITLGERECSIQRRHQKLIEETPAPGLTGSLRARMSKAALRAAKAIGYTNAGTAEFLLTPDNQFFFIEFNARIQVHGSPKSHGVDLVKADHASKAHQQCAPAVRPCDRSAHLRRIGTRVFGLAERVPRCHLPAALIRVDSHLFAGIRCGL